MSFDEDGRCASPAEAEEGCGMNQGGGRSDGAASGGEGHLPKDGDGREERWGPKQSAGMEVGFLGWAGAVG